MSLTDALLLEPHPFEIWIAKRTDGLKGSGTASDPYDGSTQAKFDAILSGFSSQSNMTIRLGPGEFQTNGYNGTSGWQARPGMKIIGSGIDVTTLKLINVAPGSATHYFAIGHVFTTAVDAFEVSHLTIDCNMAAANTNAACGGVRVHGSNVLVHRIKVKNWGTRTTSMPCHAIAVIPAQTSNPATEVKNGGIEDCIVVEPATVAAGAASAGTATALHAGPVSETGAATLEAFGLSPYIRNCFVDGSTAGVVNLTYDFRGISMSWCHAGVVEGNHVHNVKTGGPYSDKTSIREMVVRNNFYKNVVKGPFLNLGNLCAASLTAGGLVHLNGGVLEIGIVGHSLKVGDRFKLVTTSGAFDGTYRVDTVATADSITVKTSASGSDTTVSVRGQSHPLVRGLKSPAL